MNGDDHFHPGEETIFEHLRDNPPGWLHNRDQTNGWREGLTVAQEQVVTALGDSFGSCPYDQPVAGLTPQAVWEMAIINAASRMGVQIFDDMDDDEDDD